MSPEPHAHWRRQHCPAAAAPRSYSLPTHCHIPYPFPSLASADSAPVSPLFPCSPGSGRRPAADVAQDGGRSGGVASEHGCRHTDSALAPWGRVLDGALYWERRGMFSK